MKKILLFLALMSASTFAADVVWSPGMKVDANKILAGPSSGGSGAVVSRSLVIADLPSATTLTAALNVFGPDLGAGGVKGLVPATVSGDGTKFLRGDGTWVTIGGGGDALTANPLSQFAATTSLQFKGVISDETGSGAVVFADTPTLITPVLGAATATSINGLTITSSTGTLTITNGKTATISNTLTFAGTDGSTVTLGTGGTVTYTSNNLSVFASTTSAQLRGVLSDESGTGLAVFNDSPTLITPALGTPSAVVLTNGTGLPISTGVSGLGANVATFLATPSSANLATAITDETGTGVLTFATAPTFTTSITSPKVIWTGTVQDNAGSGTPEGVVTAPIGSVYRRTDGGASTTLYVKESGAGNTGWIALGSSTLADADYGDITVSGTGTVMTIDNGVVNSSKMDLTSNFSWTGNHTFDDALTLFEIAAGGSPAPGYGQIYIKDDHNLYFNTNANGEQRVSFETSAELGGILTNETGSGLVVFDTSPTISGTILEGQVAIGDAAGTITPAQITSNQDDYSPSGLTGATIIRVSSDASRFINGIVRSGSHNNLMVLINVGSFNISLADQAGTSTAAYRLALGDTVILKPGQSITLLYDTTASRWRSATGSFAMNSPITTSGDMIIANGSTSTARLGIGSTNQILSVVSGLPAWTSGVNPNVEVTLTHNTATTVTSYTVPTRTSVGGTLVYTVTCEDGTEVQSNSGTFKWQAYNKADTFSTDSSQTQSTVLSSGTLTVTFSFVTDAGTDNVAIKCTASSSLTPTTLKIVYNNADGSVGTITIPAASVDYSNLTSANMTTLRGRNRIINGNMAINQRTASSVTPVDQTYMLDRWMVEKNYEGTLTWSQSTTIFPSASDFTTAGRPYQQFQNSLLLSSNQDADKDAGEYLSAMQKIEGYNIADLIGDGYNAGFTISFWVKCSTTGTYGVGIRDSVASRSYIAQYTISGTGWEYKTLHISAAPSGGTWNKTTQVGLLVDFTFHVGTTYGSPGSTGAWTSTNSISTSTNTSFCAGSGTSTVYLTGVQLEPGTSATPFEMLKFSENLAMCQRYYEKSYEYGTAVATSSASYYTASVTSATTVVNSKYTSASFRVPKRVPGATLRIWDFSGNASRVSDNDGTTMGADTGTPGSAGEQNFWLYNGGGSITPAKNVIIFHWDASIEL